MTPATDRWRAALLALGIEVPTEGPLRANIRPRFYAILGGLAVLALLGGAGMVKYSTSPTFCRSCHIMEPYYKAWSTSKHNHVACVDCHYPPGSPRTIVWHKFQALSQVVKYVTRTYSSKPFAEVEDASCLRSGCHSKRLLEGKVFSKSTGVRFDHRPHLETPRRDRQLRCTSCHSQMVIGSHVEVTYDTCFLCHFKGRGSGKDLKPLGGCRSCHDVPARDIQLGNMTYNHRNFVVKQKLDCQNCHVDVVRGEGKAPRDRCFTCHNQPEKLARYSDGAFLHDNHVAKHNVACFHCHEEIQHGLSRKEGRLLRLSEAPPAATPDPAPAPAKPGSAATLHAKNLAFECSFCHEAKHGGQREMYSGDARSLGLPELPSPMFLAEVDCVGCHYKQGVDDQDAEFRGGNLKASDASCVKCHGAGFKGVWQETRKELGETLEGVQGKLKAARQAVQASSATASSRQASAAVERAARLERFVRLGRGEHNVYLASVALRKADQALGEAGAALGAELPDLSGLPLVSGSYCATMCHDKVGVKVPPETVKAFGKTMPHLQHTQMMGCVKCHDIAGHKRVPLRPEARKTVCAECHPDWAK